MSPARELWVGWGRHGNGERRSHPDLEERRYESVARVDQVQLVSWWRHIMAQSDRKTGVRFSTWSLRVELSGEPHFPCRPECAWSVKGRWKGRKGHHWHLADLGHSPASFSHWPADWPALKPSIPFSILPLQQTLPNLASTQIFVHLKVLSAEEGRTTTKSLPLDHSSPEHLDLLVPLMPMAWPPVIIHSFKNYLLY